MKAPTLVFAAGPSKDDIEAYMQDKYGNITWLLEKDLKKTKAINENEFYLGAYDDAPIVVFDPLYALGGVFNDDRVHLMMVYDIGNPSSTMDLYKIKKAVLQLMQVLLSQSINKIIFRGNKAPKGFIQEKGFRYDNRTYLDICNLEAVNGSAE